MIPRMGYLPEEAGFPFEGLNTLLPSTQLKPGESPVELNCETFRGLLRKRAGLSACSAGNGPQSLNPSEPIRRIIGYTVEGASKVLTITNSHAFVYNATADTWTSITVSGIALNNSMSSFIDATEFVDSTLGRCIVVTNGYDAPFFFNESTGTVGLCGNFTSSGAATVRSVGVVDSYLVFGGLKVSGSWHDRDVMWCDTGDLTEWVDPTSNAGDIAGLDLAGAILRLVPYAGNLAVVAEASIGVLGHVTSGEIFSFQKVVPAITIVGPGALTVHGPLMYFAGYDNLYSWDGGRLVTPVGDKVAQTWRDQQLHIGYVTKNTRLFSDVSLNQLWWMLPTGYNTDLSTSARLGNCLVGENLGTERTIWHQQRVTYSTADLTIIQTPSTTSTFAGLVVATTDNMYIRSASLHSDSTAAIESYWETPDLTVPQSFQSVYGRWLEVEFEASGTALTVSYSTDRGNSWVVVDTVDLSSTPAHQKLYFDTSARTLRLRFTQSDLDGWFALGWYRVWLRPGGAR